ncbi:uncharacterized protein K441DRAFT_108061 [Cenococcum geophilum 1.58]|uniref:uncharacterized protein n=1 Tax=Cenococcum geophilum 1.58 TaxID=794803 RepID=UPI00358E509A|nr:hypothetical protein K441DRAFT_108061 [Cenococcum geophilum 1.58]
MIVLRTSPKAASPILHRLTPGIGPRTTRWVQEYLTAGAANSKQSAYLHLQELAALVNLLASLTDPNETLVFCPTSVWNVHRVPLHAPELPVACSSLLSTHSISPLTDEHPDEELIGNILAVRNRIVYTYSRSLLHINFQARQSRTVIPSDDWRATVLSPLSQLPLAPHTLPLKGAFKPVLTRTIDTNTRRCLLVDALLLGSMGT